jgi:hypothetical protein
LTLAPAFVTEIVVVNGMIGATPEPLRTSTLQLKLLAYVNEELSLVVVVALSIYGTNTSSAVTIFSLKAGERVLNVFVPAV